MAQAQLVKRVANSATSALIKAAPAVKDKALAYIQQATKGRVATVQNAVDYAPQNKGTVALVTRGVVQAGVDPRNIFTQDILQGMVDRDLLQLRKSMMADFDKLYGQIDSKSTYQAGDQSLKNRERLLAGATERVRGIFGGDGLPDRSLQNIHVCLKMFLEMSEAELSSVLADKASHQVNGGF